MDVIDQITFRAPHGSNGEIVHAATSIRDQEESRRWLPQLEPCLRAGGPLGRGYLNFGQQAAFIRWLANPNGRPDWTYALALIGQAAVLTGPRALEYPDLAIEDLYANNGEVPVAPAWGISGRSAIEARVRSSDAARLLVPLLGHALSGERQIILPWTEPSLPESVIWGLGSILTMLGDERPVSFLTYMSAPYQATIPPGLFTCFRPSAAVVPPDPGFEKLARTLVTRFADDPERLYKDLAPCRTLAPTDQSGRINRLLKLNLEPHAQAPTGHYGDNAAVRVEAEPTPSQTLADDNGDHLVICPICLGEIRTWNSLGYWRWDAALGEYVELTVPASLNSIQRARILRGAHVRCPESDETAPAHFLPVNYGRFGPPVLLGFIGLTKTGKSHLLASMVGAIENGELEDYGIATRPIDHASHRRFMDEWVDPLLSQNRVLQGTREGIVEFADAFLMSYNGGPQRPVALFDVAGGDLSRVEETNQFLWIADGLFFVVDPDHTATRRAGDETFRNVLDVIQESGRADSVSAAIILNKADKVRFEEPVTHWLRSDTKSVDATDFLRESADVYAYLNVRGVNALAAPYLVCNKTTLHFASPTGGNGDGEGGVYPRGVSPRRVVRPLVAMLAMTGVLSSPEAERVGI